MAYNDSEKWRDTGLLLPKKDSQDYYHITNFNYCFDATHPGILLVVNTDPAVGPNGIYSYNWLTNQKSLLIPLVSPPSSNTNNWACNEYNGLYFIQETDHKTATRFSVEQPQGQPTEHFPTDWATDGTLQLYSIDSNYKLWASSDGGLNWQERTQAPKGVEDLAVTRQNGQTLYLLTKNENNWAIYFSADAGITWEKRREWSAPSYPSDVPDYSLKVISGGTADVNTLELVISYHNPHIPNSLQLSVNGARTFYEATRYDNVWTFPALCQTSLGIVLVASEEKTFRFTTNGGKDWQELTAPFTPQANPDYTFRQAQNRPENLYLQGHLGENHPLWYSGDGGRNWQKLGPDQPTFLGVTPYAPTTLIGVNQDNKLQVLNQPAADKSLTKPVIPGGLTTAQFFPETGHNLQGVFLSYWQTHGGLAQFGYPKTEPFREYNPSDGKVYTVQYFERNRFEYHPENRGTDYEVLLGLLGNQLTATRRASDETPFRKIADPGVVGVRYFSETGHTLRNQFKAYWEGRGGLAIYGYPISEEFEEINPDDGRSYIVQYFERNRFEYHPENKGSQYEVLLGLLGNTLLKIKSWL